MTPFESLRSRIVGGRAVVGVVGLGYVGLPLAGAMHSAGLRVLGFDTDPAKIDMLARGETYLRHLGKELTRGMATSGRFQATGDFSRLAECDCVLVCVPTPLDERREPDLGFVLRTAGEIGRALRPGQLIVLESTTYPGTTRGEFVPAIERAAPAPGLTLGRNWFAAYSPEREDPGNRAHSTATIPKLVGGVDDASCELAALLYGRAVREVVRVASAEVAEAAKILENVFRAVNIALVNELKIVFEGMGIDVWEVVRAAATKPFGYMPFWPGPGMGGHCIPIDPFYLSWRARRLGLSARFVELAGEINALMPAYVIDRLEGALRAKGAALAGSRVLVLGLAYKPDIDDVRESPSFELIRLLRERGAQPDYSDPHVPATWPGRRGDLRMRSVPLSAESVSSYDAVVIGTNHSAFDYGLIAGHARLVVDTRDAMRAFAGQMGDRLVRA